MEENLADSVMGFFMCKGVTGREAVEAMTYAIAILCATRGSIERAKKAIDQAFEEVQRLSREVQR